MSAMTRGVALVDNVGRVMVLTGRQGLANLEADGETSLPDLLISASDAIYDQLSGDNVDPTDLANAEVYERAVAWHFLALLVAHALVPLPEGLEPPKNEKGQLDPFAWSDPHYSRVQPLLASANSPARAGTLIPKVRNVNCSQF